MTPRTYQLSFEGILLAGASVLAAFVLPSCSSGVGNAGPRVQAIPAQSTTGGTNFSVDLATYVSDREGQALTYRVLEGGGSFAGSVYSNTFPTLGAYTVRFEVHDNEKITPGDFVVTVTTANLALLREADSGLLLLDTDTEQFVRLAAGADNPRIATTLSKGKVLYNVGPTATQELWVFDTMTRQTAQIGAGHAGAATYVTRTGSELVLFTCGDNSDLDLFSYDPQTGAVRAVSANAGEQDGNPMVNKDDLVFFERGAGGQTDIYYYDPSANASVAVSTNSAGETLQAVLADGGVVFSRIEAGFTQLFYFRRDTGLTTIPTPATAATAQKAYVGKTENSDVIFRFTDTGIPSDALGWWNANGTTGRRAATTATASLQLSGITAAGEMVLVEQVTSTDHDLYVVNTAGVATFSLDTGDLVSVKAISTDGTNSYVVYQDTTVTNLNIRNVTGAATTTVNDGAGLTFLATLDNADVIYQRTNQTNITVYDISAAAPITAPGAGMTYAGPGADAGDFAFTTEVAAQTDLFLWDSSATTALFVSNNAADDTFQAVAKGGKVLFTRDDGDVQQLHVFDPENASTEQLTTVDEQGLKNSFTVLNVFSVQ